MARLPFPDDVRELLTKPKTGGRHHAALRRSPVSVATWYLLDTSAEDDRVPLNMDQGPGPG